MSLFIHEICSDTRLQLQVYSNNSVTRVLSSKTSAEELSKKHLFAAIGLFHLYFMLK